MMFDRDWCTAVSGTQLKVDIDTATGMRANVIHQNGQYNRRLILRGAAPLPRCPSRVGIAGERQYSQLPAYRVVAEAYCRRALCFVGFMPSHHGHAVTSAVSQWSSGWFLIVFPSGCGAICDGWTALEPSDGAHATTVEVPPVPAGGAVDFAAGTCRVAFYTPEAVAGGFVEAPHAKMELRFVATETTRYRVKRPVPTLADSGVELYPATATDDPVGAIWRFAS
jgi:hypothetical protein